MSRKILSKHDISQLSIKDLIKHKQNLNQTFKDLKEEINRFVEEFNYTKKCLFNKLSELQKYRDSLTEDVVYPEEKPNTVH